jgi:hypothetical protein
MPLSLPTFPQLPEGYSIEESLSQILTSIAMEEIGLSHIINSEGEKLQYVLGTLAGAPKPKSTIEEILEVNESVKDMLSTISMSQMFLFGKMTSVLSAFFKNKAADKGENPNDPNKPVTVRNVEVIPPPEGLLKGATARFAAKVYLTDESEDTAGVTWLLEDVTPPGSVSITENGELTAELTAQSVKVIAVSVTNPEVKGYAVFTVKSSVKDKADAVSGRILPAAKAGDNTDWIEVAQNGIYSLIVRTKFITISQRADYYGDPEWQITVFGENGSYAGSEVQKNINLWFNAGAGSEADNLAEDAKVKLYTVRNNAAVTLGVGAANSAGKDDSISRPADEYASSGQDIAFALSYSEAANFVSDEYAFGGGGYTESAQIAKDNFREMQVPNESDTSNTFWLRSPGSTEDTASSVSFTGKVFQAAASSSYALLYPALWVKTSIFD